MTELKVTACRGRIVTMTHPEQCPGEVWLTNSSSHGSEVRWPSKRIGIVAYGIDGERVLGHVPVFVSEADAQRGLDAAPK